MRPIKWIRKNQRKLMTFLVIFIMVAFVGGVGLQTYLKNIGGGKNRVLATYCNGGKIKIKDWQEAQVQLQILRALRADIILRFKTNMMGIPDFNAQLLGQVLFGDTQRAVDVSDGMKNAVNRGQFPVDNKKIDEFFQYAGSNSETAWILLKAEARQAGFVIPYNQARENLSIIIPQISQNRLSATVHVNSIIQRLRVPAETIISTYGDLLSILTYFQSITSSEDMTLDQIQSFIGKSSEKISAEYVKVDASKFTDKAKEPTEQQLLEQFEKYKHLSPGQISKENPYAFGYKLPARVQLEYLIFNDSDIKETISETTQEEMEEFYRKNIDNSEYDYLMKYEVQIDPNDPELKEKRTKDYPQVSKQIKNIIERNKANSLADVILNDARDIADSRYEGFDLETVTPAQLRSKAIDYSEVSEKLNQRYKVKIHSGKTGLLSMSDINKDRYLGRLRMQGQSATAVPLSKVVFAVDELENEVTLGRFEVPKPKMWTNISPIKDRFDKYSSIYAMVRVIDADLPKEPADINTSYSIQGCELSEEEDKEREEKIFTVKDNVEEDLKLLNAMETAKSEADKLAGLIRKEKDWYKAIEEFNKQQKVTESDEDIIPPQKYRLDKLPGQPRTSLLEMKEAEQSMSGNPRAAESIKYRATRKMLIDELYSQLPEDQLEAGDPNSVLTVMEFKPEASYYVIRTISKEPVTRDDYSKMKDFAAYQIEMSRNLSLGLTHFMPENIYKRMQYKVVKKEEDEDAESEQGST